nr:DUF2793 domain-containing protein [uncultured Pseudomonas sp.]
MTTTSKLGLELLANSASNQALANATFAQLNQLVQAGVVDKDLSTPPGSPANEALYIVASGTWGSGSTKTGQLAYWLNSTGVWQFIAPREGMLVHVNDEDEYYKYTGSAWQIFQGTSSIQSLIIACSDETTALSAGTAKVKFRMPYAFTLTGVRASLSTEQTSGIILTIDINEGGTTILSTKLTIDNGEKTSTTAATAAVISDAALADDAEITIDLDQIGDGTAKGLKVTLIGYQP